MDHSAAIMCTFVSVKTLADGTPRVTLEASCSLQELAALGLMPGAPFALARLTKESSIAQPQEPASQPETPKEKPGPLCVLACQFCADPMFWKWFRMDGGYNCNSELDAKNSILEVCSIDSRKDLDVDTDASERFHRLIRKPFMAWRNVQSSEPKRREAA